MEKTIDVTVFEDTPTGRPPRMGFEPRPWARFLAKWLDVFICEVLFVIVLSIAYGVMMYAAPDLAVSYDQLIATPVGSVLIGIAGVLLLVLLLESISISLTGGTPGKALMGISVRAADGRGRLTFGESLARTAKSLTFGLALFIPLIGIFTQANQYNAYKNEGFAGWDDEDEMQYASRSVHAVRWTIAIILFAIYRAIQIALNYGGPVEFGGPLGV